MTTHTALNPLLWGLLVASILGVIVGGGVLADGQSPGPLAHGHATWLILISLAVSGVIGIVVAVLA